MYCAKWFKTEEEARKFKKEHGGALYRNVKGSHTKTSHKITAYMMRFDPDEYPYSVNWNEDK